VCGVQALQKFSGHFLTPYRPALKRGTVEELEERVSILKSALQETEAELDRIRKGKQAA
jgi:arsenite/tail-anchored protein-transporting ATPase